MSGTWHAARAAFDAGDDARALRLLTDGMRGRAAYDALSPAARRAIGRNADAMKRLTRSPTAFPDLDRAAVARIAAPLLLIHGASTSELHMRVIDELAAVVPHARRAVIPAAGHGCAHENPQRFNEAVLGFLAEITG